MDKRGRHEPGNKTPEEAVSLVKDHIGRFPQYESHYSRGDNPHRKYLSPDLPSSKMYSMYKETSSEPVSEWIYRKIFTENFNLLFGRYVPLSLLLPISTSLPLPLPLPFVAYPPPPPPPPPHLSLFPPSSLSLSLMLFLHTSSYSLSLQAKN